jgi:hypothetical protein
VVLTGLLTVLLTVIPGATPAWARPLAGTMPGSDARSGEPVQPGPPTGLNAKAVSSSEIDLSWTPPADASAVTGYDVFDSTASGQEGNSPVNGSQSIQGTTYPVTGLATCKTYYFQVAAEDSDFIDGTYSNEVPATTFCPAVVSPGGSADGGSPPVLEAPTGLTVTAVSSSEIDLSWTPPREADLGVVKGYDVFTSTAQGQEGGDPVNGTQLIQGTTFPVTGLASGKTYYFVVDANDGNGNDGADSNEVRATTLTSDGSPAAVVPAGSSDSSGGSWWILPLLIFIVGIPGALIARRRRKRRTQAPRAAPASTVQAVPQAGPPGVVVVRPTGRGATHTVRIEPSPGPSITTIEEVPPR